MVAQSATLWEDFRHTFLVSTLAGFSIGSILGFTAAALTDRVPFLPGTGSAKLDETLELTEAAMALGADAALVITPYYSRPTQEGLYEWYATGKAEP